MYLTFLFTHRMEGAGLMRSDIISDVHLNVKVLLPFENYVAS